MLNYRRFNLILFFFLIRSILFASPELVAVEDISNPTTTGFWSVSSSNAVATSSVSLCMQMLDDCEKEVNIKLVEIKVKEQIVERLIEQNDSLAEILIPIEKGLARWKKEYEKADSMRKKTRTTLDSLTQKHLTLKDTCISLGKRITRLTYLAKLRADTIRLQKIKIKKKDSIIAERDKEILCLKAKVLAYSEQHYRDYVEKNIKIDIYTTNIGIGTDNEVKSGFWRRFRKNKIRPGEQLRVRIFITNVEMGDVKWEITNKKKQPIAQGSAMPVKDDSYLYKLSVADRKNFDPCSKIFNSARYEFLIDYDKFKNKGRGKYTIEIQYGDAKPITKQIFLAPKK